MAELVRKNFEFDKRFIEIMVRIKDLCGLKTELSVVEEALVLLAWAATESAEGRKIGSFDTERRKLNEITSTALTKAKLHAESKGEEKSEVRSEPYRYFNEE